MITKIVIIPEDEEGTSFAIQDERGLHISDAYSLTEAVERARTFAEPAGLDEVTVKLYPK